MLYMEELRIVFLQMKNKTRIKMETLNRIKKIAIYSLPVLVLSAVALAEDEKNGVNPIPPDALIVDVRTPGEYFRGHYPGAINIPLSSVPSRISEFGPTDRAVVVYCRSGRRLREGEPK